MWEMALEWAELWNTMPKVNNRYSTRKKKSDIQGRSMQVISREGCPWSWESVSEGELRSQQQFSGTSSPQ